MIAVSNSAITPGMPEKALTAAVKLFTGKVIGVNWEAKETAKSVPSPEKAVRKTDLKKCLLLSEAVSIIIRDTVSAATITVLENSKKSPRQKYIVL